MQKLDRLGWAAGMCFDSYGVSVGVRANEHKVLTSLAKRLPPEPRPVPTPLVDHLYSLWVGGAGQRRSVRYFHQVFAGAQRLLRTLDLDEAVDALDAHLRLSVAATTPNLVFVHAGVVAWKGRALVLPGRSWSGKTNLVVALLERGATYYSDEYAPLDTEGRVHPYPRPLSIRQGLTAQRRLSASDLEAPIGVQPIPVGWILVSKYKPTVQWRPRPVSAGEALMALLDNAVQARLRPENVLPVVGQVASTAMAWRSLRGEAQEMADLLLNQLD